jgi:hypothetical protein
MTTTTACAGATAPASQAPGVWVALATSPPASARSPELSLAPAACPARRS